MHLENDPSATDETLSSTVLLQSLQKRADRLLNEFRSYQSFLVSKQRSKDVETRIFRRGVEAEFKSLGTFAAKTNGIVPATAGEVDTEEHESKQMHVLRSSNLPFYEAIWDSAKTCKGIRALGRRLYWDNKQMSAIHPIHPELQGRALPRSKRAHLRSALVDIVADDGSEWIKVSVVSAKRLIFEMAKEGWEAYGDDSDLEDSSNEDQEPKSDMTTGKLDIIRLAEDLGDASRATRINYQHPKVKFVLPRLREGEEEHIDVIIAEIRATGATVECGEAYNISSSQNTADESDSTPDFDKMLVTSGAPRLTTTLNIDCTILLALISDISHVHRPLLPPSPSNQSGTYHTAIVKQIESEESTPLLPNDIYPTISGRNLVCTSLAAKRMREIVQTMGTPTESARAEILLAEATYHGLSPEELTAAWQKLSCHALAEDIKFPIAVQDFTFDTSTASHTESSSSFPESIALRLARSMNLSPINASVFMYGWAADIVTVTSNRVVAAGIERNLNQILDEDERASAGEPVVLTGFSGPKMYVCETARSLVGKEKGNGLRP